MVTAKVLTTDMHSLAQLQVQQMVVMDTAFYGFLIGNV